MCVCVCDYNSDLSVCRKSNQSCLSFHQDIWSLVKCHTHHHHQVNCSAFHALSYQLTCCNNYVVEARRYACFNYVVEARRYASFNYVVEARRYASFNYVVEARRYALSTM